MSEDAKDAAEQSAALVLEWVKAARAALGNANGMTATERNRTGELAVSAATWLAEREAKLAKVAEHAQQQAFKKSLEHLPAAERMQRLMQGF